MAQLGNKKNSQLNREWATHVRKRTGQKRLTSKRRRNQGKKEITCITKEENQNGGSAAPSARLIDG